MANEDQEDVYNYITQTGTINVDTGIINSQVTLEFLDSFGTDLNVNPNTPQGILINMETLARSAVAQNNAQLANQINPNLAGGVFLDAIGALTNSVRSPATPSIVYATVTGIPNTIIPAGSQAQETIGLNYYQTTVQVTIPEGGTLFNVEFQSVLTGEIPCAAGVLTSIISNIIGWETVYNPNAAVVGSNTQDDVSFRNQRNNTIGQQGQSLAGAIIGAVSQVENVSSLFYQENIENTTEVINGVSMVAHSIYLCVAGGTNLDVATAILEKKSGGCNWNNGASQTPITQAVIEPFSGQTYEVEFDRPDIIEIYVAATIVVNSGVNNPAQIAEQAIIDYGNGELEGFTGLTVGQNVSCFEIAAAIASQIPNSYVQSVTTAAVFSYPGVVSSSSYNVTGLTDTSRMSDGISVTSPEYIYSGTVTSTSYDITGLSSTANLLAGMLISDGGINIPSGTYISSIGSDSIVMTAQATGSSTENITFSSIPDGTTIASIVTPNSVISLSAEPYVSGTILLIYNAINPTFSSDQIVINPWQQAVIEASNITVTVNTV